MRWLVLLLFVDASQHASVHAAALPEIETGTRKEAVAIERDPWHSGCLSDSNAVLVCEVVDASFDVQSTPQKVSLAEWCDVQVIAAFGHRDQVRGIAQARLQSKDEQSPYVSVDPEWGRLRHLKKGRTMVVLLHTHEQHLSFGEEMLLEINAENSTLPDVLRRTALDPSQFTEEDLEVLARSSPFLHRQVLKEGAAGRARLAHEAGQRARMRNITFAALGALILVLLVRRNRARAQNPTT